MPKMNFSSIGDIAQTITKLNNAYQNIQTVYDRTTKDMISRAPGKIANAVTWMYGIKKSEVMYKKDGPHKSAGKISIAGQELSTLEFRYSGRLLTPLHFGMTPKQRPEGKKKYKIKAKIKKRLKAFEIVPTANPSNGIFLAPAAKGSSTILPWFRYSEDPYDIKPIKTVSLPQMVDNKLVKRQINKDVGELFHKRFDHHLSQYIKGNLR